MLLLVNKLLRFKQLAFVALLLWLIAGLGGVHSHFCFDGKEPPMSVHMDVIGGHSEHAESEEHRDVDVDMSPSVAVKYLKIDLPLLAVLALILVACKTMKKNFHSVYSSFSPQRVSGLRPPLRAPPSSPV